MLPAHTLRTLALGSFFVALAGFEVVQGLRYHSALRERRLEELAAAADRGQSELVRELNFLLEAEREHVRYLATKPAVRELLMLGTAEARQRANADVLASLVAFAAIDRISLADANGREWLRCERIGEGVGAMSEALLALSLEASTAELLAGIQDGEIRESSIEDDQTRVEMPPSKRQVIHFGLGLWEGEQVLGTLVMTVYAAPLLEALHAFAPLVGASTVLLDRRGQALPTSARAGASSFREHHPEAWRAIEQGQPVPFGARDWFFARPLELGEWARVVTLVPAQAVQAALSPLQRQSRRIFITMLVVTLAIAVAAVFFLRQSLVALKMRETERYLALVRRESEKWKALIESAADHIWIVEPRQGRLLECNAPAAELFAGRRLEEVLPAEQWTALRGALAAAGEQPHQPRSFDDLRLPTPSGGELILHPRLVGLDLDGERVVEVALRDVTRERGMERALAISERLSSLGLLTAGVAHEINNPLEGIGNYLSLLGRADIGEEKRLRYVENLRVGFERIRDIVRDLLNFARPGVEQGDADLAAVVARAQKLFGYADKAGAIEFEMTQVAAPSRVAADPGRLEQVLLNLMLNAAQAMGGRGLIKITVRATHSQTLGPAFALAVEDQGPGIAPEHLSRIFDPFFTTKQGTGLGLSVSYGIVRAYGGELWAENGEQGGARFTLELPQVKLAGMPNSPTSRNE